MSCSDALPDGARFCPQCGAPCAGSGVLSPGTLIGDRYRIISRLGQGGMSSVYLARHERLEREVAIKLLHPRLLLSPRALSRFAREARLASGVPHPNIVEIFDFGASGDVPYLVMEHVPGIALDAEIAARGPFEVQRAAHVLAQIADALAAAHAAGLVHRDLKPSNAMLVRHGPDVDFVKILDFGLAIRTQGDVKLTQAGELVGTPHYLAPEAWEGRAVDVRTDIYAFGVLAFELVTGQVPFDGPSYPALMMQHVEAFRHPPSELNPTAAPLDEMIVACIAADPANRPQGARELIDALRSLLRQTPAARRRTTYARALGTGGGGRTPDPTVYDSSRRLDAYWDGPAISAEITALHAVRRRRLKELVDVLWERGVPVEVAQRVGRIDELDGAASLLGEQIAALDASIAEREVELREREAYLRSALFRSNLWEHVYDETMPAIVIGSAAADDDDDTGPLRRSGVHELESPHEEAMPPAVRVTESERRLDEFERERRAYELESRRQMEALVCRLDDVEQQLRAPSEALWKIVVAEARKQPELKGALLELSKVDGAIAAFQGLVRAAVPVSGAGRPAS